ncbi:MerR family transcriptional regulator [Schaalia sp. 19OD2882]|uniref:MerR family transcriptional regulator n=1 Tax=Schaalia sp. 19OD2882 TaxID=2794089 RepID=UPI001C1E991D|nr:MerR family transcriptional regulator [Schaalia sp. 19OD2882]QWW19912.1 MerR family transcriptional regulator [Schaalia sp. 19OD2882]
MRIQEMADLAGTTPRTIRHYHALGLLPVPTNAGVHRRYGLEHLARLLRIRWLADSGLSLERIGQILPEGPGGGQADILTDLRATREEILHRIEHLHHQHQRIERLIARVEDGEDLSPLPQVLEDFYTDMERRFTDLGAAHVLRQEKHMMTLLATTGMIPAGVGALVEELDEEDRAATAELITRFSDLAHLPPNEPANRRREIAIADGLWQLVARHRHAVADLLRTLPTGIRGRLLWSRIGVLSTIGYPHPSQRALVGDMVERLDADPTLGPLIRRVLGKEDS